MNTRRTQLLVLRDYFLAHPHTPVDAPFLAELAGSLAVHSRIADLRRKFGMLIEWKPKAVERNGQFVRLSRYVYSPTEATENLGS